MRTPADKPMGRQATVNAPIRTNLFAFLVMIKALLKQRKFVDNFQSAVPYRRLSAKEGSQMKKAPETRGFFLSTGMF
jgi:hypothetical protein